MALLVLQLNDATELTWERHTGSYGPRPAEEQEPETAGKESLAFIVARHELAQHFAGAWLAADPREPHCPPSQRRWCAETNVRHGLAIVTAEGA